MSRIRNAEPRGTPELERMRRKRDQAWELAGYARQDGDTKDEQRWTAEAQEWEHKIREVT